MRRTWSAGGRTALWGLTVFTLLVAACGAASGAPSTSGQQQGQAATTLHAYSKMLRQDGGPTVDGRDQPQKGDGSDQLDNVPRANCSTAILGVSPASPQAAGASVTLTGAATHCTNPTYEFWVRPPGGNWSVVRAFSPSATASWQTAGLAAGTYSLDVWAKPAGPGDRQDVQVSPIAKYTLEHPAAPSAPTVCTSVTWNQPTPVSPQSPGTQVKLSGTASGCTTALYQFWVQPTGGTWAILQAYSTSSTATWGTTGLATGSYTFDIWAKQSGSSASWEAHLTPNPTYTLQAGAPCSSVTWNPPSPAPTQAPGTQITLGGVAAGCPNPQYQFWIQPPGGAWAILLAFGSSSSAAWNTGGAATGTYLFDIWARQLGSSASWEAHIAPNPTYTLETGPACTSSTLTFNPVSPQKAGTSSIQLTATSSGCPNPTYQFWVLAPGGQWAVLQAYTSSSSAIWPTTGLVPGTYLFDVWVKQAGNSSAWEAHIAPNPTYTLF